MDRWFPHRFQVIPLLKYAFLLIDVKKASNMARLGSSEALDSVSQLLLTYVPAYVGYQVLTSSYIWLKEVQDDVVATDARPKMRWARVGSSMRR